MLIINIDFCFFAISDNIIQSPSIVEISCWGPCARVIKEEKNFIHYNENINLTENHILHYLYINLLNNVGFLNKEKRTMNDKGEYLVKIKKNLFISPYRHLLHVNSPLGSSNTTFPTTSLSKTL